MRFKAASAKEHLIQELSKHTLNLGLGLLIAAKVSEIRKIGNRLL